MNAVTHDALDSERAYQDATAANWNHKGTPSLGEEILMLSEYVEQARKAWMASSSNTEALTILRKAGGVICRAMDNRQTEVTYRVL